MPSYTLISLRWRHNGCDSVSNHQPRECLLSRLIRRTSKKTSQLRVTGLCAGNSPETGEFPAQMASNAENVSIWWRHHVMYCNQIWGSINLSKLQVLQNKAVRIVTGSPPRSNSENIYICSGIMKLTYINTYLMGRFMYRIYHKTLSAIFDDFFRYNYQIHDHDTRTASHLNVPPVSSNLSKAGIRYKGVIIWNKILTVNINPDSSEQSFKMMLKNSIVQQLIKIEFINNRLMTKLQLMLLLWPLSFIVILINSVHVMYVPYNCCTCTPCTGYFLLWMYLLYSYGAHKPFEVSCPLFSLYIWYIHVNLIVWLSLNWGRRVVMLTAVNWGIGHVILTDSSAVGGNGVGVMAALGSPVDTCCVKCNVLKVFMQNLANKDFEKLMRSFDVFFDLRPNKRLCKQSKCRWFEIPSRYLWRHSNLRWDSVWI